MSFSFYYVCAFFFFAPCLPQVYKARVLKTHHHGSLPLTPPAATNVVSCHQGSPQIQMGGGHHAEVMSCLAAPAMSVPQRSLLRGALYSRPQQSGETCLETHCVWPLSFSCIYRWLGLSSPQDCLSFILPCPHTSCSGYRYWLLNADRAPVPLHSSGLFPAHLTKPSLVADP